MQQLDIKNFQEALKDAQSVLILMPEKPKFDAVAASLALGLSLKSAEKDVTVASPSEMIVAFNRLIGVDKVVTDVSNRNLIVKFKDYNPANIERVSYEIANGEFCLFITPKTSAAPPSNNQIKFEYSKPNFSLVIVVGAEDRGALGKFAQDRDIFSELTKVVLVNNSPVSGFQNAIELINPASSSVSEVIFQLIEAMGLPIDQDIAQNLFDGLREGTESFQLKVTPDTFVVASRLLRSGAKPKKRSQQEQVPPPFFENKLQTQPFSQQDVDKIPVPPAGDETHTG